MTPSPIDDAWRCVLEAGNHDWSCSTSLTLTHDRHPLIVQRGGVWHGDVGLDAGVRELFDCLLPLVARREPLAIAQLGQSLDGRIATVSGASHYINGLASRVHLHRLRALVDAVLVGVGTVEADDPQLSVRHVSGRHPVRVVLDPRGRAGAERHVFQSSEARTLHLVGEHAPTIGPVGEHVERVVVPLGPRGVEPRVVIETLAARGIERVLIEGGATTVSRFVEAGVLQWLHVLVAPLLIGSGRPGLELAPVASLDQALRPACRTYPCGDDTLFALCLAASDPP